VKKISPKGFTVLELLIVIAIMCILIALILVGLDAARAHSQDENKMSTIQTIVVGLGQYHDICNSYPPVLDATTVYPCLGNQTFASLVPNIAKYNFTDPNSGYEYAALASPADLTTCTAYHIGGTLETTDSNEVSKAGFLLSTYNGDNPNNQLTLCNGSSPDFDGTGPLTFDLEK
jgi:prepilin-type N-terminal cleavage/methylation domain-containing protein